MKSVIVQLGRYRLIIQRYPTSRKVVPSQLQRELAEALELGEFARMVIKDSKIMEHAEVIPKRFIPEHDTDTLGGYVEPPTERRAYDVHPLFQPKVFGFGGCRHTDEEIREMAHKVHVREQAGLMREAVDNDPAFLGANDPAFRQAEQPMGATMNGHAFAECEERGCLVGRQGPTGSP